MSLRSSVLAAVVVSATVSSTSSAAILIFTDQFLYDANTSLYARSSENFASYSGAYASLNGAAGGSGGGVVHRVIEFVDAECLVLRRFLYRVQSHEDRL